MVWPGHLHDLASVFSEDGSRHVHGRGWDRLGHQFVAYFDCNQPLVPGHGVGAAWTTAWETLPLVNCPHQKVLAAFHLKAPVSYGVTVWTKPETTRENNPLCSTRDPHHLPPHDIVL